MIPNIFVSSTILDLHHLRDSIRDTLIEIGFTPIMSEHGDIGYLPSESAEDSCYLAIKDCQLAIFIIGKRYGEISKNGLSITHNEFRTTRKQNIPVIFLVDQEIMSFQRVFDTNKNNKNKLGFPGMDNPSKVFEFIREFADSEINNGLVTYLGVQSAKENIKKQLAHIVGDLLRKSFDPIQNDIKDVLSEVMTLKHALIKNQMAETKEFAVAYRELLDKKNEHLKNIIETISGSLEEGIPELLECDTLKTYFKTNKVKVNLVKTKQANKAVLEKGIQTCTFIKDEFYLFDIGSNDNISFFDFRHYRGRMTDDEKDSDGNRPVIFSYGNKLFKGNQIALDYLEYIFYNFLIKVKLPQPKDK